MIQLYVLNVPEFEPVIHEGSLVADRSRVIGNYVELSSESTLTIDRRKARARRAVWFSSIGALRHGKVTQFDGDLLRVEPD